MLVGVDRLHRAFPRTNFFVENAANIRNRMQIKMAADVFVMEAGAEQEGRRVNRSACDYHRLAADGNAMTAARLGFHACCGASFDANALRTRFNKESRTRGLGIGKPCFGGRWFRADRAAIAAIAADFALLAGDDVARHGSRVPAQRAQPALQDLFARGDAVVVQINGQARANGVEAACIFITGEPRDARRSPFRADISWRAKRTAVVDDRASAEAFPCK